MVFGKAINANLTVFVSNRVVVTHAGSPVGFRFYGNYSAAPGNPSDRSEELVERFKQRYTPIVKLAEDKGVTIAIDGAVRMGNIACNPQMWERVLDAAPSENLGLSCDPSHWLWMMILPVEDAIRMFAGKWVYADVKDCEVSKEMLFRQGIIGNWWWQYRVPGRGQLNWGTIIGALLESGYDYALCVENEDHEEAGHAPRGGADRQAQGVLEAEAQAGVGGAGVGAMGARGGVAGDGARCSNSDAGSVEAGRWWMQTPSRRCG